MLVAHRPDTSISIHALREEGDAQLSGNNREGMQFLSTPSARRATKAFSFFHLIGEISIHALREEGDRLQAGQTGEIRYFYPRPPRGGRPVSSEHCKYPGPISIHALREEGDAEAYFGRPQPAEFLSTPSARRATAKTETKSLFSNKLYNILHEFRRALIYNGSKNYPNHAKRLENPVRRCRKDAEDSPFAPGRKTQNNSRPSCSKGG